MDLKKFRKKPLLGILRGITSEELAPVFETILASGLEAVEITWNTPGAAQLIRTAVKRYRSKLMIGAGTILTPADLRGALQAGASFIVSPVTELEVVGFCAKRKIPVFPGALTPQEVLNAWNAGATMVKVFPAGCFGPSYLKELHGPFDRLQPTRLERSRRIELLACGGVTPENIGEYFKCGANAAAIGSGTLRRDWLRAKKFSLIRKKIQAYLEKLPR